MNKDSSFINNIDVICYGATGCMPVQRLFIELRKEAHEEENSFLIRFEETVDYAAAGVVGCGTKPPWNEVSGNEISQLEKILKNAHIPLTANGAIGLDGTDHTLSIHAGSINTKIKWWGELPKEYEVVKEIVEWMERNAGIIADE